MRYHELLTETSQRFLPVMPENIAAAKQFVFAKWKERAKERGQEEPVDLTSACKFASLFAAEVFGGQVRGHFFHQWVELPDGQQLDLNAEAQDVAIMLRGEIHPNDRAYADIALQRLPTPFYTHDARHMRSRGNRDSMASIKPRVDRWVEEFLRRHLIREAADIESPAFKAWFAGSKVVKNGKPMMMFHGTGVGFQEFLPGSHFGTQRAANHRVGDRGARGDGGRIIPVYLSIKRPLRLAEDLHAADESALLSAVLRGHYPGIDIAIGRQLGAYVAAERAGYDGLVYRNHVEDRGKLSWVVFHPSQVRSALTDE